MTKLIVKTNDLTIEANSSYKNLLEEIKLKLKSSQLKASISVNHELIQFYWDIGKLIVQRQDVSKWGDKLFEILAHDLSLINNTPHDESNL